MRKPVQSQDELRSFKRLVCFFKGLIIGFLIVFFAKEFLLQPTTKKTETLTISEAVATVETTSIKFTEDIRDVLTELLSADLGENIFIKLSRVRQIPASPFLFADANRTYALIEDSEQDIRNIRYEQAFLADRKLVSGDVFEIGNNMDWKLTLPEKPHIIGGYVFYKHNIGAFPMEIGMQWINMDPKSIEKWVDAFKTAGFKMIEDRPFGKFFESSDGTWRSSILTDGAKYMNIDVVLTKKEWRTIKQMLGNIHDIIYRNVNEKTVVRIGDWLFRTPFFVSDVWVNSIRQNDITKVREYHLVDWTFKELPAVITGTLNLWTIHNMLLGGDLVFSRENWFAAEDFFKKELGITEPVMFDTLYRKNDITFKCSPGDGIVQCGFRDDVAETVRMTLELLLGGTNVVTDTRETLR